MGKNENGEKKRRWFETLPALYVGAFLLIIVGQMLGALSIGVIVPLLDSLYQLVKPGTGGLAESDVWITGADYLIFVGIWALTLIWIGCIRKNRPILSAIGPASKGNNWRNLLLGTLIGFGMNGFCILIAWLHKDIALYFNSANLGALLYLYLVVLLQSSAEELVCRGFLYQKLLKSYQKPAVAIIGNSLLFGMLHLTNPGVTVLSFLNIVIVGVLFSLMVYYMDSLWCAFTAHAAWNFTQAILFGLPNSGMVSPYSVFRLDAGRAVNSFAYNVGFGIEGTVLADLVLFVAVVVFLVIFREKKRRSSAA